MSSIKVVLLIVVLSIAASFTFAQQKGSGRDGGRHLKMIAEKLHLTDQQKDKIKSLQADQMKKMIDLRADLKKTMVDLKAIKDKPGFTRKDVLDQVEKMNKVRNEMALSRANHLMDIWEMLTPEQQKIAKENPQWFMNGKHRGMMHKGMHPKP